MSLNYHSSRRVAARPMVYALEQRALLNAGVPDVKHLAVHAEVASAKLSPTSTFSHAESMTMSRAGVNAAKNHAHDNARRLKELFTETNLVSNVAGMAPNTDPNMQVPGDCPFLRRVHSGFPTRRPASMGRGLRRSIKSATRRFRPAAGRS